MSLFTGLAPNLSASDARTAASFLFFPRCWSKLQKGSSITQVEQWFKTQFNAVEAVSFDSGRTALEIALSVVGVTSGEEVVVPGYTCLVVSNSIMHLGAKPIYIDIDDSFRMDQTRLQEVLQTNHRIRAIIVQHTFGIPEHVESLRKIADEYNIPLIEDCAHVIDGSTQEKRLGSFGDMAIFSFGSEKVVSSGRGGLAITSNREFATKLREQQQKLPLMSKWTIVRYLLSFMIFYLAKPLYWFFVGKLILFVSKKGGIIPPIISAAEKKGGIDWPYPCQYANALATIVFPQLLTLSEDADHRELITDIYKTSLLKKLLIADTQVGSRESMVYMQFPILIKDPLLLAAYTEKNAHMQLGTSWTGSPVAPRGTSLSVVHYEQENCSNAVTRSAQLILLPTHKHVSTKEAESLCQIINFFCTRYD